MSTLTQSLSRPVYKWNGINRFFSISIRVARIDETMARLSLLLTIAAVVLTCVFAEEDFYSNRYDDVDIEGILANEKLRLQYYNCFMDTAPCKTADAKFFKGKSMHEMLYINYFLGCFLIDSKSIFNDNS